MYSFSVIAHEKVSEKENIPKRHNANLAAHFHSMTLLMIHVRDSVFMYYVCMCVCVRYVCCVCMYVWVCFCVRMRMCVCVCVCLCVLCVYVCLL